jgi:hypothetical protein
MTWEFSEQEFEAVMHRTAEKQYHDFVGHCADRSELWGLLDGETEWGTVEDERGHRFLAVWPHPRYRGNLSQPRLGAPAGPLPSRCTSSSTT